VSVETIDDATSQSAFLEGRLDRAPARDLKPRSRALYALALMLACRKQTEQLQAKKVMPTRSHYLERAFEIIGRNRSALLPRCLAELLVHAVVEPHLFTTLRKMSQGQKCSLRFYFEGPVLRPTGTKVLAGYSGDRLGNLLGMWADLGMFERLPAGRFRLTDRGRALLASL